MNDLGSLRMVHHVVIVGGGFGGLYAARRLNKPDIRVTLIDRRNFHLFQPLLYQVATGALSPANIAAPLRAILKRQKNTTVLLGTVTAIDPTARTVTVDDKSIGYDTLIVATGVRHSYFGNAAWESRAPGLKTIEDATNIRRRVLLAFENAEREFDPLKQEQWLTFGIVGGGPTGVELAGAIAEISRFTLRGNFRNINPARARILLFEGTDRVLPTYPADLSQTAKAALERMGVTVLTKTLVTAIDEDSLTYSQDAQTHTVPSKTVLWAAGVQASGLSSVLQAATGVALDRAGRVMVEPDCTVKGHPDILVIGDLANFPHQTGKPLPGVAQVAMQQGKYAARLILARRRGEAIPPFHYRDLGNMATIGRASAVADLGWIKLSGFLGWVAWLFIHLINLVEFESRILVLIQWAGNYFTRNRSARLITMGREADRSEAPPPMAGNPTST
jgi:NADH dehydrogenase